MVKQPIARLLRVAWDTLGRIVARVVADQLDGHRLRGLIAIGVDEVSCRRGQRYLTMVADHGGGTIVARGWPHGGHLADVLRRARRAQGVDPRRLD
jgi:transposase